MDASNNSIFSLVPEQTIVPGATVTLLFSAGFNNNVLNLSTGSAARGEIIVSFGNASKGASRASNIDIDGSGQIDADEALVRSVPTRIGFTVPAPAAVNNPVTVSDTLADITTTGTVTFSNAVFNLGPTGGTIKNCAHLTGTGMNVETCSTHIIAPQPWEDGDIITYSQNSWGDIPAETNAAMLLLANYNVVYTSVVVEIGIAGAAGFSIRFTDRNALLAYLPAFGAIGPLFADHVNPAAISSGAFGGDVMALRVNVDFADADLLAGTPALRFGDLHLCAFTTLPAINDLTVREFLDVVNTLLGGGTAAYTINDLGPVTDDLTRSFLGGVPSAFAQATW